MRFELDEMVENNQADSGVPLRGCPLFVNPTITQSFLTTSLLSDTVLLFANNENRKKCFSSFVSLLSLPLASYFHIIVKSERSPGLYS